MTIPTTLTTYGTDDTVSSVTLDISAEPRMSEIRAAMRPTFGDAYPEHVTVLHEGRRADMFVDEDGHAKALPRNDAATAIYRANALAQDAGLDPETLPWIAGPAVLFSRIVWS
jgi:hypothetical protein